MTIATVRHTYRLAAIELRRAADAACLQWIRGNFEHGPHIDRLESAQAAMQAAEDARHALPRQRYPFGWDHV